MSFLKHISYFQLIAINPKIFLFFLFRFKAIQIINILIVRSKVWKLILHCDLYLFFSVGKSVCLCVVTPEYTSHASYKQFYNLVNVK